MRVSTPVGRLPATAVIAGNVLFWPVWTVLVGYAAQRTPDSRFAADDMITRTRPFEREGAWYRETLQIERWKAATAGGRVLLLAASRSAQWLAVIRR